MALPILILDENVNINSLFLDSSKNSILIGTSDGRIIKMNALITNAYLTGERSIYAQLQDGFGNISNIEYSNITYQLKNQIFKILENKEMQINKQIKIPLSASIINNKAKAIFTSQVLNGGDDFVAWKSMEWEQNMPAETDTTIYVRIGNTIDETTSSNWYYLENSNNTGAIAVSLDNFSGKGRYIQMRIVLSTEIKNLTPSLYNLNIFYKTVYADFFFTQKYILKKGSNIESLMLVANINKPQYTEIKFGVSDGKTTDWSDYHPLELDKITEIPSSIKDRIKIGIKLIPYTDQNYPVVEEFALMFKSEKENLLNK